MEQMNHKAHSAAQHQAMPMEHADHSVSMFRDRFWLSLVVTLVTTLFSPMVIEAFNLSSFPLQSFIPFIGGTFLMWYGGLVFIQGSVRELRTKLPGMMTLISLALVAAYSWSVATTFLKLGDDLFIELTSLITIMLLGHWIEMRSVANAEGAVHELAKLLPDMVERIKADGSTESVAIAAIQVGDKIRIRPGGKIPVDGELLDGSSSVNEAMITGESAPVEKQLGSMLIAGTVNGSGVLTIKATRVGSETTLAGIMRLVADAQASRSRSQVLADKAAFWLTVIALTVGMATLAVWLFQGAGVSFAIERLVAVLVIACPHALGLAIPLVTAISTTLAARSGILVRKRIALEAARRVDVVLFDKTGTLTTGDFGVDTLAAIPGKKQQDVLAAAAAVEAGSEHALARAILAEATKQTLNVPTARDATALPGQGIKGSVGTRTITIGGPQLLTALHLVVPQSLTATVETARANGQTVVFVVDGSTIVGAITLADQPRPEAAEAVRMLKQQGLSLAMITGDSKAVAQSVAKTLGIETVFAEVLPSDKVEKVKALQQEGKRVMMVGDGVNDAAALAQADVGVAIGAGTDVAIESAGIVLMKNDPRDIVAIIRLARASYTKTVQNLIWATGYNVVAIPLAAGVLASQGILLTPAIGAIFMSFSTVVVAINAQFLRRLHLS